MLMKSVQQWFIQFLDFTISQEENTAITMLSFPKFKKHGHSSHVLKFTFKRN